ncbi:MAG: hypothetical protein WCO50_07155 [Synechococcus sp. ELA619]
MGPEADVATPQPQAADPQAPTAANPLPPGCPANARDATIPAEPTPGAALDAEIQRQNALLAATGVALRLERRGNRLGLRGPLPRPTKFDTDDQIAAVYAAIKASVADPITITNKRMPQGGSLSASDVDIIVQWYNKGGKITD